MSKENIEIVDVTTEIALDWLTANTHNRPLKPRAIEAYAADMRAGVWSWNGEAIKFDRNGRLQDGQNRLHAVIESGKTIKMLVVRNLEPEAQDTMDSGVKRKFSDVLKLHGEENHVALASITRRVYTWKAGVRYVTGGGPYSPSNMQLAATLAEHPELRDIAKRAQHVSSNSALPTSIAGLTVWLFDQIDKTDSEHFFERLASDQGHHAGEPIYELRKTLTSNQGSRRQYTNRSILLALTIKAWNAYRDGRKIGQLRFAPGGARPEKFPDPA
jgi:hypothetical protein